MSRKLLPLIVVGIFVLSGLGAVSVSIYEESEFETFSVSFSQPILTTENEFITVDLEETNAFHMEDGKPILPSYTHTFTYPFGTKIKKVTCELGNFQQKTLSKIIKPSPKIGLVSQKIENSIIQEEEVNYGIDPYPNQFFDYDLGCGRTKDGLSVIVNTEIVPVKYYPNENTIEWINNAVIKIEYELPIEPATVNDVYELIILAPDSYSDELAPLVAHKISMGISTKFVSLNDIYNSVYFPVTGRDNAERIKYFIKNAYENWGISYVLLVGGHLKFPVRISHIYVSGNDDEMEFVSDLYYADIYNETGAFVSWDSDSDDVFGEFNWGSTHDYDIVDLHPDVYIGRLACVNSNEVTTCVNKIKNYELGVAYEQDWFLDAVFIGGETWPDDNEEIREGEYIQEHIEDDYMTEFSWDKVWESNGRLGKSNYPWGIGEISNAINNGCGFLEWSGHGNLNVWASHRYKSHEWIPTPTPPGAYYNTYVKLLSNGDKLPITVIGGCLVGKFNADPDCFAWSFMLNSDGGAIAVTAATEGLYSADGSYTIKSTGGLIEISMFKSFKELGAITFGEMWAWALENYITTRNMKLKNTYKYDYVTVEEWQPFGDPTLQIAPQSGAPNTPAAPNGPNKGTPGKEYTYYASTTDPEEDDISYMFSWGDGTYSGWIGPVESGEQASAKKTWNSQGNYEVRVLAKDIHGKVSAWSDPLSVTMPRNRAVTSPFLKFLQSYSNLFPILRYILGL